MSNEMREAIEAANKLSYLAIRRGVPDDEAIGLAQIVEAALTQQPESEPMAILCREIGEGETTWFDHNPLKPNTKRAALRAQSPEWEACAVFSSPQPSAQVPEYPDGIKRFDVSNEAFGGEMEESATGSWVRFADVKESLTATPYAQVPESKAISLWKAGYSEGVEDALGFVADCQQHGEDWHRRERPRADDDTVEVCRWQIMELAAPSVAEKREWISCQERLPTIQDADYSGKVWFCSYVTAPCLVEQSAFGENQVAPGVYWLPTGLQRPEPPEVPE